MSRRDQRAIVPRLLVIEIGEQFDRVAL